MSLLIIFAIAVLRANSWCARGKTGLIRHCFQFPEIKQGYYTFFIDIYDSRSLRDLVFALSKEILEVLKPMGKKALHGFWECVKSLQASISFDVNGMPSLNLGLGDIQAPATTLDEIFRYLEQADKPCFSRLLDMWRKM